jgi:hypothetical protein
VADLVPSFVLKMSRAEKHLIELEAETTRYADSNPYEVRTTREGKRDVHRLWFTVSPSPEIAIIAGDFIYNLRSGLGHLAGALVPSDMRRSVEFPVFWQGVWEDGPEGENKQRAYDRKQWRTYTRKMKPQAVAILKSLQPEPEDNVRIAKLDFINRLCNTDRHTKVPVIRAGLRDPIGYWKTRDGQMQRGTTDLNETYGLAEDGAKIHAPDRAVDVKIEGAAAIGIRVGNEGRSYVLIPESFREALDWTRTRVIEPLVPYLHVVGGQPASAHGRALP